MNASESQDHSPIDSSESQDHFPVDSSESQDSTMDSSRESQSLPPRKRSKLLVQKDEDNDDDDNVNDATISGHKQFAIPKDVKHGSASRTIIAWKKLHEINLLRSILEYYNKNGTYPFDDDTHMQKFYKGWIERGVYMDEDAFNNKMVELPERFFKNQEKTSIFGEKLEAWMPPIDAKIYRLSHMIWGNKAGDDDDYHP